MKSCAYCDANALYRDRASGAYLCPAHARLDVTGPRGKPPRPPVTIRIAAPADRPQIARMLEYCWGETEVECFEHTYQADALPAFLACDGDEIVGLASYAREGDAINLVSLNVLPRWQGMEIAARLIGAVIETARADGVERVIVSTTNDDLPALALYQNLGFVITGVEVGKMIEHHGGVETGFSGIPVRDEIHLELKL